MTAKPKSKSAVAQIKSLLAEDRDAFKQLLRESLQEVLEAEMSETVGAQRSQRCTERLGYSARYAIRCSSSS